MTAYATQADVYAYGLPRGSLGNPARIVVDVVAPTSTIELSEHGFVTGDAVTFRVDQGGTLPSPLVAGTTYYVIRLTDSTFQVTSNGSPVTLTTDGSAMFVTADLPFDTLLEFYSRWADCYVPAHAVPLKAPYPVVITGIVAQLVAARIQVLSGVTSVSMKDVELAAKAQLERFFAGLPVRGAESANTPTNLAMTDTGSDPRGWYGDNGSSNLP